MTGWDIYLLTRVGAVKSCFTFCAALSIGCLIVGVFVLLMEADLGDNWGLLRKHKRKIIVSFCAVPMFMLLAAAIPTTNEMLMIYAIPKIAANEDISALPGDSAKLLRAKLREWLKDTEDKP